MVEDVDGAGGRRGGEAWRGRVVFTVLALTGVANACGGRSIWVDEATAGEAGDAGSHDVGGTGGYGGDYGGAYGGDYGGGGYGGSYGGYGGDYGGAYGGYGGDTGGSYGGYGGDIGGSYGGYGGVAGTYYGGAAGYSGVAGYPYGGTAGAPYGGFGGSYGGVGGSGKGGCGPSAGAGGAGGFPGLGKGCSVFCQNYPYATCQADFSGPRECLNQCQTGFGLAPACQRSLYDFLVCAGGVLDPNAQCMQGDLCFGPGCTSEALTVCANEYYAVLQCQSAPIPPCPPPPDPPPPPGCFRQGSGSESSCQLITSCQNTNYVTQCNVELDGATWACDCFWMGTYVGTVRTPATGNECVAALPLCGFP